MYKMGTVQSKIDCTQPQNGNRRECLATRVKGIDCAAPENKGNVGCQVPIDCRLQENVGNPECPPVPYCQHPANIDKPECKGPQPGPGPLTPTTVDFYEQTIQNAPDLLCRPGLNGEEMCRIGPPGIPDTVCRVAGQNLGCNIGGTSGQSAAQFICTGTEITPDGRVTHQKCYLLLLCKQTSAGIACGEKGVPFNISACQSYILPNGTIIKICNYQGPSGVDFKVVTRCVPGVALCSTVVVPTSGHWNPLYKTMPKEAIIKDIFPMIGKGAVKEKSDDVWQIMHDSTYVCKYDPDIMRRFMRRIIRTVDDEGLQHRCIKYFKNVPVDDLGSQAGYKKWMEDMFKYVGKEVPTTKVAKDGNDWRRRAMNYAKGEGGLMQVVQGMK